MAATPKLATSAATTTKAQSPLLKTVIDTLEDYKVQSLVVMNISKYSGFTDYLVIGTGTSSRHVASLASAVHEHHGPHMLGQEGAGTEWVCTDLGSVVVHLFTADKRALYNLEKLWSFPFEENKN